jgi:hypothetical protein
MEFGNEEGDEAWRWVPVAAEGGNESDGHRPPLQTEEGIFSGRVTD